MTKHVNASTLNLRSAPEAGASILGALRAGEAVEPVGPAVGAWIEADTAAGRGFVSTSYLRAPLSPAREALVAAALAQWKRFGFGSGHEASEPYAGYVGEMWSRVGYPGRTGRDREHPWSAAAISFMVEQAGAYPDFRFNALHARYVNQAVQAKAQGRDAPFWGCRPSEAAPEPGDIVCAPRVNEEASYEAALAGRDYPSHCDVVMAVRGDALVMVGGNVAQSVAAKTVKLAAGRLPAGFFALLKNRR